MLVVVRGDLILHVQLLDREVAGGRRARHDAGRVGKHVAPPDVEAALLLEDQRSLPSRLEVGDRLGPRPARQEQPDERRCQESGGPAHDFETTMWHGVHGSSSLVKGARREQQIRGGLRPRHMQRPAQCFLSLMFSAAHFRMTSATARLVVPIIIMWVVPLKAPAKLGSSSWT